MADDPEKVVTALNRELRFEQSWRGALVRGTMFRLGFAQCRHCVHCDLGKATKYRQMRESILPPTGTCNFNDRKPSGSLDHKDLKQFHSCPGFERILYNFKDYGFPSDEIVKIRERRWKFFATWMGWIVALGIAVAGWILK